MRGSTLYSVLNGVKTKALVAETINRPMVYHAILSEKSSVHFDGLVLINITITVRPII